MGKIWSDENVQLLIRTIREYEHIWNTKHPLFTLNKRTRHNSWKEITDLFNQSTTEYELKPMEICTKWNNLRVCFQKESQKVLKLGLQSSRWKYYDLLTFLIDHPIKKQDSVLATLKQYSLRRKRPKREAVDETELISVGSISPVKFLEKSHQQRFEKCSAGVNTSIPTNLQCRPGLESTFGDYVAAEMKRLELDLQMRAKKVIFDVLMELQYEQENRRRSTQL